MEEGNDIRLYNLSNGIIDVVLCNYGCTIVSIDVPDRNGQKKNIVAGFNSPETYKNNPHYFGCTVGRFANRIAFGKFSIDGQQYQLACNNGVNHLHGGINAFDKQVWKFKETIDGLMFNFLSVDGEEGYPGNLNVTIKFSFADNNKLVIGYTATTDKATIINLTNHTYFNLTGFEYPTVYNHFLKINANNYTVKNENNVPTGEIKSVVTTPYDFLQSKLIGTDINELPTDMGYDINYVLETTEGKNQVCAELYEQRSGRLVKVFTTMPGLQVYTANWWDGLMNGSQNELYQKHGAVALETQSFPDAPNHKNFPDTILRPGSMYQHETVYQFLTIND